MRFRSRIQGYSRNPVWKSEDHNLLLSAFLASQGRSLTWANHLLSQGDEPVSFNDAPDTLGLGGNPEIVAEATRSLCQEGYYVLPTTLDAPTQTTLTRFLSQQRCNLVSDDPGVHGRTGFVDFADPLAEIYQVDEASVVSSPAIQRLLIDRTLLSIAHSYFSRTPKITNAMAWFTFPGARASEQAAQKFHFDMERLKWLKVFFFLTDVGPENGPHTFIPGTHVDGAIPKELLDFGYDRIPDDAVQNFFHQDRWNTMTGTRGHILIEDTRGLHKGTRVVKGHRLVLQFQYSSDYFGSACAFAEGYPPAADEWLRFSQTHPQVLPQLHQRHS